jgi:hypothetical protein
VERPVTASGLNPEQRRTLAAASVFVAAKKL